MSNSLSFDLIPHVKITDCVLNMAMKMELLNCKITVFPLNIVFINFPNFDETQDNGK